jgi:hypothetical protein
MLLKSEEVGRMMHGMMTGLEDSIRNAAKSLTTND